MLQAKQAASGPSGFHHHIACHGEQEVDDPQKEYQMKKPHEPICTSKSTKRRLIASLEIYRERLNTERADIKHKEQIEKILKKVHDDEAVEAEEEIPKTECWQTKNEDKISGHTYRLIHNLELLEKLLKEIPPREEDSHKMSHKKFECEQKVEAKKGPFDQQYTIELAHPKKIMLKSTLESFREFMSPEKQQRIECQLGIPEDDAEGKQATEVKRKKNVRDNEVKLLSQIERKITSDIFDTITWKLTTKLPEMIVNRKEPMIMTPNVKALHNSAFKVILSTNGPPNDQVEYDQYQSFAGLVGDFVVKTMSDSLGSIKNHRTRNPKPLKALTDNQDLVKIAQNIMTKYYEEGSSSK